MSFRVAPRAKCALLVLLLSLFSTSARAQDVIFVEATISGTVRIGTESLRNVFLSADSGPLSSSVRVDAPGNAAPFLTYELPVNVPEGEVLTYDVQAYVVNLTDGNRVDFPRQRIDVAGGDEVTVDFVIDDPGFVEGQVRVLDAAGAHDPDLLNGALLGFRGGGYTYLTRTDRADDGLFRFPVLGGTLFSLLQSAGSGCCYVRIQDGPEIRISPTDDQKNLTVAAGGTLLFDLEIEAPLTGTIAGTVAMPGPVPVERHRITVRGPGVNGGVSVDELGEFSRGELVEGTYSLSVRSQFNDFNDLFQHPGASFSVAGVPQESNRAGVVPGETTFVDVSSDQAFLDGTLELTGSVTSADLSRAVVEAHSGGFPYQGLSWDYDATDGVFDLVVSPGSWEVVRYNLNVDRADPERPIDAVLGVFLSAGHRPTAELTAPGETVELAPIELPTGTLTIHFESLDGTLFSRPRVTGTCIRETDEGERIVTVNLNARDDAIADVTQARVVMAGIESECSLLRAQALVDGALVTFGILSGSFIPGSDQETDLGAPTLTVEAPEPGLLSEDAQLLVRGRATDDVVVASVTVNGVEAALTPAGNPEDDHEVLFEVLIDLADGPNEITTVATDGEGRQASDVRTVFFVGNRPPVADAGDDQVLEQQGPDGALATLDGSRSSDPDDDPLSFAWTGPFGSAGGASPAVLVPAGTHVVTLVVNDGEADSPQDSVTLTVRDTTPPELTKAQLETELWPPNHKLVRVATVSDVSDLADPDPAVAIEVSSNQPIDGPGDGSTDPDWEVVRSGDAWDVWVRAERSGQGVDRIYTIEVTATDASGNGVAESCTVTVPHDRGKK